VGGRVLRLEEGNPNKFATVVDFVDQENTEEDGGSILFAQILGKGEILNPAQAEKESQDNAGKAEPKEKEVFEIEGIEIVTDVQEVMAVVNSRIVVDEDADVPIGEPPEGWVSWYVLAWKLSLTPGELQQIIDDYAANEKDQVKNLRRAENKGAIMYLHPDLAEKIVTQVVSNNMDKYMTLEDIAKELELDRDEFVELLEASKSHKEMLEQSSVPKISHQIAQLVHLHQSSDLELLGRAEHTAIAKALKIQDNFLTFFDDRGERKLVVNRERLRIEDIKTIHVVGRNWISATDLMGELKASKEVVDFLMDKYIKSGKRGILSGKSKTTRGNDFFLSPNAKKEVSEMLKEVIPPEGWESIERNRFTFSSGDKREKSNSEKSWVMARAHIADADQRKFSVISLRDHGHDEYVLASFRNKSQNLYLSPEAFRRYEAVVEEVKSWPNLTKVAKQIGCDLELVGYFLPRVELEFSDLSTIGNYINPAIIPLLAAKVEPMKDWVDVEDLGIPLSTLVLFADLDSKEHSSEFFRFAGLRKVIYLVSPGFAERLKVAIDDVKKMKSAATLGKELAIPEPLMREMVKYYDIRDPGSVARFADNDLTRIHVTPKLEKILQETTVIPAHWQTVEDFAATIGADVAVVHEKLFALGASHEDQVGQYWNPKTLRLEEFYGENILADVRGSFQAQLDQFNDWLTAEDLAARFEREPAVIVKIIASLPAQSGIELSKKIPSSAGEIVRYNPGIVSQIADMLPPPNEDWMTVDELVKDIGKPRVKVQAMVAKKPEQQQTFYHLKNKRKEVFLSPDLVEEITEALS
jgi:hypothetical protein